MSKKIERAYFGPAKLAYIDTPDSEVEFDVPAGASLDVDILEGFSEAEIHTYIRLKHILARLKMPAIPADKMQPIEDMLKLLLEDILGDGKVDTADFADLIELVMLARKFIFRR